MPRGRPGPGKNTLSGGVAHQPELVCANRGRAEVLRQLGASIRPPGRLGLHRIGQDRKPRVASGEGVLSLHRTEPAIVLVVGFRERTPIHHDGEVALGPSLESGTSPLALDANSGQEARDGHQDHEPAKGESRARGFHRRRLRWGRADWSMGRGQGQVTGRLNQPPGARWPGSRPARTWPSSAPPFPTRCRHW